MKHAYVVLDNDTPLFVAHSEREAGEAIDYELGRIEETIRRANGDDEALVRTKLEEHHLSWVMLPYVVPTTKKEFTR